MTTKTIFLSLIYALGQIGQGLFLHPHQTIQSLVREKIFAWMVFSPIFILLTATLIWRYVVLALIEINLPLFFVYWFIFFCIYWQSLLIYLLVRFVVGFRS